MLPLSEVELQYSRSSGPGGQHAQKSETRAVAVFDIAASAALIIVAVFAGFASGKLVQFQQMGFGVAIALLLDATVIRSVVLPATLGLLDSWSWYLPRWLEWLPHVEVEAAPTPGDAAAGV